MGKYTVITHDIHVVGKGWLGQKMATTYGLTKHEVEQMALDGLGFTREGVQAWLDTHAGDFSCVDDFWASLGEWDSPFETEEGGLLWNDIMFGNDG